MTMQINGTSGLVFNDASTQNTAATGFGFKNRIINGAMMIDQRNAGASYTVVGDVYTLDRWKVFQSAASKFSVQQNAGSVTPPTGFTNYLGVTSLSSYSVSSGDYFLVDQAIEGYNISDLNWGTANAATVTLSFWVRSSLTGTFGGCIVNSSYNRTYPFTYTISSANTWEQKSVTIDGSTLATWGSTNNIGLSVRFVIGCGSNRLAPTPNAWVSGGYDGPTGSTSVVGTNGATWYVTGVQLEKGSTATSFDYRPYGTELALCQRYFYTNVDAEPANGVLVQNNIFDAFVKFPVTMRTAPSFDSTNPSNGVLCQVHNANYYASSFGTPNVLTANGASLQLNVTQTGYAGQSGKVYFGWGGTNQRVKFSAEL